MESAHGPGHCDCHAAENDTDPFGTDLLSSINLDRVYCLNEGSTRTGKNVFKPKDLKLERDVVLQSHQGDPELLLFIPFICPVKIMSLCVIGGGSGTSPNSVRIFKDKESLDLSSVGELPALQAFELLENLTGEIEYMTRVSRFTNTTSIVLHFPASTGEDYLCLSYIGLKGESSGLERPRAIIGVYESRPMEKDNKMMDELPGEYQIR